MAEQTANNRDVIIEAKRRLANADCRFNEDAVMSMRVLVSAVFGQPDISEMTASDYGVSEDDDQRVVADFWEEVKALEDSIDHNGLEIRYADWQRTRSEAAQGMYRSLNRRSYALQLWDQYAVPIRLYEERIVAIWAPQDVMGSPMTHSYAAETGLAQLTIALGRERVERLRCEEERVRYRERYQRATVLAGMLLVISMALVYVLAV